MATKTFEDKIASIDKIIESLESNSLSLDESVKLYNEGITLTKECQKQIEKAKIEVTKISDADSQ